MISAQMNPFMQLVGLRDGQGQSPNVMYLHGYQKQQCICCGYQTFNLWIFGMGTLLCTGCYEFAINMTYQPVNTDPWTVEGYLLKAA